MNEISLVNKSPFNNYIKYAIYNLLYFSQNAILYFFSLIFYLNLGM